MSSRRFLHRRLPGSARVQPLWQYLGRGALILLLGSTSVLARPEQVVSLSLCSDHLLLLLADREQIASLSYLSADARFSRHTEAAQGLPLNRGLAEEVLAFQPDLILSSRFSASAAVSLLRRLGHDVTVLDFPEDLDSSEAQIRELAALLQQRQRGEALIETMRARITPAIAQLSQQPQRALFLSSNGVSFGAGTLRDHFLQSIGWHNVASELGLSGVVALNLEQILAADPDLLLIDPRDHASQDLAHHFLQHPALRHYDREQRLVALPDALFECVGPNLAEAYDYLATAMAQMETRPQ